jgi:Zn ribbon nucleic-acid-binding protein
MGSVIDYIECPNCKEEAFSDYYYKTDEEYINCSSCGYHYSYIIKRDDEGKMIKIDESKDFAIDNVVREEKELKEPYGAYRIKHYDSVATQCGSLSNESEYNDLVQNITDNDSLIESASVSKLINENIITETLK